MPDLEKVINALGRCESYGYCEDKRCPYYGDTGCLESMRKDALELLKEQETIVRCKDCKYYRYYGPDSYYSSECMKEVIKLPLPNSFCVFGERR